MKRIRSLLVLFALLALGVIARLAQVQILEHDVWAAEAASQVLQGREQPYRRGRILDAKGSVLARDEELRTIDLVYREFRRSHPLGQLTHARSLLEGRPVPLSEAHGRLVEWTRALGELTPGELRAFGRGESETWNTKGLAPRLCRSRAADVLYYLRRLLAFETDRPSERAAWKALSALAEQEGESRTYLELAAFVRRREGAQALLEERTELEQRLGRSLERLAVLARWLRPESIEPVPELLDELERERRSVEDATAAKLFAEATGFVPGRIEVDTLLECFDHAWITALLGWDGARLQDWAHTVRDRWCESWRDGECLPSLFGSLAFEPTMERGPGDFVSRLAVVYQPSEAFGAALDEGPRPWREVEELAVFYELDGLFEADVPEAAQAMGTTALPIQVPELRADPDDWRLLPRGEGPGSFRALLEKALARSGRIEIETLLELARGLNEVWELRFQETLRRALDVTRRAAEREDLGHQGGLILSANGRERAAERAEFFLKDYGSRPRQLFTRELSYDVVYLLTRFESDYPGFRVRELHTRARVEREGDDERPADHLIGRVSAPTLEDFLRQRSEASRLRELKARPDHEEREMEELHRLIGRVRLPDQVKGVEGIEAFLEPELTGTNGWALARGLSDVFGKGGDEISVREPIDGQDVWLTLDSELQAAGQRCLRTPATEHEDERWERDPVAAIVLLSIEGDVLAAASEPDDQSILDVLAEGQRLLRLERTLKKPTFQPPGSVFKVFVAAWALEHGLDPEHEVLCAPINGGPAGYESLRCWKTHGHGPVDLHAALVQSCNAYFAWLGETLDTADFAALCSHFGFGEPTGVRRVPPWDSGLLRRSGLSEDVAGLSAPKNGAELSISLRRMAANGLGRIEATPMQLARGLLALASGELRELRLVQGVGERELPRGQSESLEISRRHIDFVRAAMRGVADEPRGTGHSALSADQLGFSVAAKTGSADLDSRRDEVGNTRVRKHAWVGGWAPAEDPQLVFVVFEHDTMSTSSHGAIFLARQLLRQPEVLLWLAERGVDVSGVPAR